MLAAVHLKADIPSHAEADALLAEAARNLDEANWNGTAGEVKSTAAGLFAINVSASAGANTTSVNPRITAKL